MGIAEEYSSNNHKIRLYPVRVWLFTILISPLFVWLTIVSANDKPISGLGYFILYSIIFSAFFSLPAFLIYLIAFWKISSLQIHWFLQKSILCLIALVELFLTLFILFSINLFMRSEFSKWSLSYAAMIIILSFSFRLNK
jgi:hypothetical protein